MRDIRDVWLLPVLRLWRAANAKGVNRIRLMNRWWRDEVPRVPETEIAKRCLSLRDVGPPGGAGLWGGCAWLLLLLCGLAVGAAEPTLPIGAAARSGKEIFEGCLLCHSTKEMQRGPILDGLPEWYVINQLKKFKSGIRGSVAENRSAALMAPILSTLTNDTEILRVAEHIADLRPRPHLLVIRGDKQLGKIIYTRCIPCHGLRGEGNPAAKAPPINLLEDWYLLDQLRKFQRGWRAYDDRDIEGKLMALGVKPMTTQELRNVVRYIAEDLAEVPPLIRALPGPGASAP